MSLVGQLNRTGPQIASPRIAGIIWLAIAIMGAGFYFSTGLTVLLKAWSTPEYSHGPLIPIISALLFLRQLRDTNLEGGPVTDRGPGFALLLLALLLGGVGRMIQIGDLVAYAIILWAGGMILVILGWRRGRQFWPPVLHLVFMLPLPDVLYYGLSTYLQGISSQLGVAFLRFLNVPVFLDGNIIDLGAYKLQVAEACSGLRYLFPILSFSYIFSVLYRGPIWHKAILLIAAGPLTVFMNSLRIAIAGVVVDRYGTAFVEGLTHFLEGWVVFLSCVLVLFVIARALLFLRPERVSLAAALDLKFEGLWSQAKQIRLVQPSGVLIGIAVFVTLASVAWELIPARPPAPVQREAFYLFPSSLGVWRLGLPQPLSPSVEKALGADDYLSVTLQRSSSLAPVDLFMAWYKDQIDGGTHSPSDCLPGAGWEITNLTQSEMEGEAPGGESFFVNRAEIQKGISRMLVYYWYEQQGERTPSSYYARFVLTKARVLTGRSDGALVRLVTPIIPEEGIEAAEGRLKSALHSVIEPLPRFVPPA